MKLKFRCNGCGKQYSVDVRFTSESFTCKQCGVVNIVPATVRNKVVAENNVQEIKLSALLDEKEKVNNKSLPSVSRIQTRRKHANANYFKMLKNPWVLVFSAAFIGLILVIAFSASDFEQLEKTSVPSKTKVEIDSIQLPEVKKIKNNDKKIEVKPPKNIEITKPKPDRKAIEETTKIEERKAEKLKIELNLPESFMVGYKEQIELFATGGVKPHYWQISKGLLPEGLRLVANKISGTPKAEAVGQHNFTLRCIDSTGNKVDKLVSCTVDEMLMLNYDEFPSFVYLGDEVEFNFSIVGGRKPYKVNVLESKLPKGLQYNEKLQKLSGKPTEKGEFFLTLQIMDALGRTNENALETFAITVFERDKSDIVKNDGVENKNEEDDEDVQDDPERTQYELLMKKGADQHAKGDYDGAIATYNQVLETRRNNPYALYNIACAYAMLGKKKDAIEYIEKAVNAGFVDYVHMLDDEDLKSIRSLTKFKKIIKELKKRYDITNRPEGKPLEELFPNYLIYKDEENKLIFLTNVGSNKEKSRKILDFVSAQIMRYAKAQRKRYFGKESSSYIKILLPDEKDFAIYRKQAGYSEIIGGWYNPGSKFLISQSIGHTLIHEFTHALHYADTWPRGVWHNIWFSEGMASCFESCKLPEGSRKTVEPIHNWRMDLIKTVMREDKEHYVSWRKLFKMDRTKFLGDQNIQYHYAEVRYIVFWLHKTGKLKQFYDAYNKTYKKDKSGIKAFEQVFDKKLNKIEVEWKEWIGKMERPTRGVWLGVSASFRSSSQGVKLKKVYKNSPAKSAKLRKGDIILRIGCIPVDTSNNLAYALTEYEAGDEIEIAYIRREEVHVIKIKLVYREDHKGY